MTERQLFLAIGELDDSLVTWAERAPVRRVSMRWLAVAAAVVLLVGGLLTTYLWQDGNFGRVPINGPTPYPTGTTTSPTSKPDTTTTTTVPSPEPESPTGPGGLPWLSGNQMTSGGIGGVPFVYAFGIEELHLADVWEETPETMPVWKVSDTYNSDFDLQKSILRHYAAKLGDREIADADITTGVGTDSLDVEDGGRGTRATTEKYKYMVDTDHTYLRADLMVPIKVGDAPDWLQLAITVAPTLVSEMTEPTVLVTGGNRSWWLAEDEPARATGQFFNVRIYDAKDADGAYAAFLKGFRLYVEEGELKGIYICLPEYYEKLGDYPTLSKQEAREVLDERCAELLNNSGYRPIEEDYQEVGMELIYVGDSLSRLRVPVYRFLIKSSACNLSFEVPELEEYYEVYISAVPDEYWRSGTDQVYYGR